MSVLKLKRKRSLGVGKLCNPIPGNQHDSRGAAMMSCSACACEGEGRVPRFVDQGDGCISHPESGLHQGIQQCLSSYSVKDCV